MAETQHPLRLWRHEQEKTLEQLARRAKVSKAYLSEIERGETDPSLATIRRLSKITGIPSGAFVEFQP